MASKLDFKALEAAEQEVAEARSWRRQRREQNPTVQMSVRMPEDVYDQFRALCLRERRTNGDMLEHLLKAYLSEEKK